MYKPAKANRKAVCARTNITASCIKANIMIICTKTDAKGELQQGKVLEITKKKRIKYRFRLLIKLKTIKYLRDFFYYLSLIYRPLIASF